MRRCAPGFEGRLADTAAVLPLILLMTLATGGHAAAQPRNPALDIDFRHAAAGNSRPSGLWSDGTTMWVADSSDARLHAYDMATGARDPARDFNTLTAAGNNDPIGIWSDGATMWVADFVDAKLYAYDLATRTRDRDRDLETLSAVGNDSPTGLWSDGTTLWVADCDGNCLDDDRPDAKLYAYNLATRALDHTLSLATDNADPTGLWSDGTTLWVADWNDDRLYAYGLATRSRHPANDFDTALLAPGNREPQGLWSDGTTLWVADRQDAKLYAYDFSARTHEPTADWDLDTREPSSPLGLWSDGATLWVADRSDVKLYAYDVANRTRYPAKDFDTLRSAGVEDPRDLWSDGTTLWVTNKGNAKLYAYSLHSRTRDPAKDFDTLQAAGNGSPDGLWSDGTTMWVADDYDAKLYAYHLATRTRDPARDFDTLAPAGNNSPDCLWSDGRTLWVSDEDDDKVYAYDLRTRERDPASDFDAPNAVGNRNPQGLWSDGDALYVQDYDDNKLYAYDLESRHHDPAKDFNLRVEWNRRPSGVWSNGVTLWVADYDDDKVYAYDFATRTRTPAEDFNTLSAAGNNAPWGLWSDGTTLWVADYHDAKVYAYHLARRTRDPARDFDTLSPAGNNAPVGLWSDGTTLWVGDWFDAKVYAYHLATRTRDPTRDFDTLSAAGNRDVSALWSDGATLWVADYYDSKVYAYNPATRTRDAARDLDTLPAAGNDRPSGLWSDGGTLWIPDDNDNKLYAYDVSGAVRRRPEIWVSPTALTVTEDGGVANYTLRLTTPPSGVVMVTPTSADRGVATVAGPVTFTPTDWSTARTMMVTGVDDEVGNRDSSRTTVISHTVAGGGYDAVPVSSVAVTVTDDDGPDGAAVDRRALTALYHATGGPTWVVNANWTSTEPLDKWHGVTTDANGRVTHLQLVANNLAGELPPELGNLTELTHLNLHRNRLTKGISRELAKLTNLGHLDLSVNSLTGSIPPDLGNLTNLTHLSLHTNRLTGSIPSELGNLTSLTNLELGINNLSGAIPELIKLEQLLTLDLAFNHQLVAAGDGDQILQLPVNLRSLSLQFSSEVRGQLPPGLRYSLQNVDLRATGVCMPQDFGSWKAAGASNSSGLTCGEPVPDLAWIHVAVVYTPAARAAYGGEKETALAISLLVVWTNAVYEMQGVKQRLVLVHSSELVDWTETSQRDDLERLARDPDVRKIRDEYGADIVHLVGSYGGFWGGKCGQALGIGASEASAFSVTDHHNDLVDELSCNVSTATHERWFAHELGHIMGLNHDRRTYCSQVTCVDSARWRPYPFGFGYLKDGGELVTNGFATIMAYPQNCEPARFRFACKPIDAFSSSRHQYNGDLVGVAGDELGSSEDGPADAVRALNYTRHSVAAFRDSVGAVQGFGEAETRLRDQVLHLRGRSEVNVDGLSTAQGHGVYRLSAYSSVPEVATATLSGGRIIVTPVAPGVSTVAVTGDEPAGSAKRVVARFTVKVPDGSGFTDDPLVPGVTPLRAVHFLELRERIDALRARIGLRAFAWTDPILTSGVTPVKLVHLAELRGALEQAYETSGRLAVDYTDGALGAGVTAVRAAHVMELRRAVRELEGRARLAPQPEKGGRLFMAVSDGSTDWEPSASANPDLRQRLVTIDTETLAQAYAAATRAADESVVATLTLNLFDDVAFTAVVERTEPTYFGGYSLAGWVEGIATSMVVVVVDGPLVVGLVSTPAATYRIRPVEDGVHAVIRLD